MAGFVPNPRYPRESALNEEELPDFDDAPVPGDEALAEEPAAATEAPEGTGADQEGGEEEAAARDAPRTPDPMAVDGEGTPAASPRASAAGDASPGRSSVARSLLIGAGLARPGAQDALGGDLFDLVNEDTAWPAGSYHPSWMDPSHQIVGPLCEAPPPITKPDGTVVKFRPVILWAPETMELPRLRGVRHSLPHYPHNAPSGPIDDQQLRLGWVRIPRPRVPAGTALRAAVAAKSKAKSKAKAKAKGKGKAKAKATSWGSGGGASAAAQAPGGGDSSPATGAGGAAAKKKTRRGGQRARSHRAAQLERDQDVDEPVEEPTRADEAEAEPEVPVHNKGGKGKGKGKAEPKPEPQPKSKGKKGKGQAKPEADKTKGQAKPEPQETKGKGKPEPQETKGKGKNKSTKGAKGHGRGPQPPNAPPLVDERAKKVPPLFFAWEGVGRELVCGGPGCVWWGWLWRACTWGGLACGVVGCAWCVVSGRGAEGLLREGRRLVEQLEGPVAGGQPRLDRP